MLDLTNLSGFNVSGKKLGGRSIASPKFNCSFGCNSTIAPHWTTISNITTSTNDKRSGLRSALVDAAVSTGTHTMKSPAIDSISGTMIGRCYIKFDTLPDADCHLIWSGSGVGLIGVGFKVSNSTISTTQNFTPSFGAGGVTVTTGEWIKIDFFFDTTTSTKKIDAKVNGVSLTQKTTDGSGAGATFIVGCTGPAARTAFKYYFDDFVCSDDPADYPLPEGYSVPFGIVAEGSHQTNAAGTFKDQTTANLTDATTDSYTLIDDINSITDYIEMRITDASAYMEHSYGIYSGYTNPNVDPSFVEVLEGFVIMGTGTNNVKCVLRLNGTDDIIYNAGISGTPGDPYLRLIPLIHSPEGVNWKKNFIDGITHRFGYSSDAFPYPRIGYSVLEVFYEIAP